MPNGKLQRSGVVEQSGTVSENYGCIAVKVGDQGRTVKPNNGKALCLLARDYKGFGNQEMNGVAEKL